MQPVVLHTRISRFAFPLVGFVALVFAAASPAAAQSPSPPAPAHSKPHPGVPLVKSDPPAAPSAAPADPKPATDSGTLQLSPNSNPESPRGRPPSIPRSTVPAAHSAKPATASRSHASTTKTTSGKAIAQLRTPAASSKAQSSVVIAQFTAPPAGRLVAQATAPSGGGAKPAARGPVQRADGFAAPQTGDVAAQSGSFTVSQLGHAVGTAEFHFTTSADGVDSSSTVQISMEGLDYALSKTEVLDEADRIQHVVLSATVNGQAVNVTGKPDASDFLLNISANGRSSTTRLAGHSNAVLLTDFDPGGLQTLLALGERQNNRDLWAILPKQAGSIEPVQLATYADEQGTLDGKPISLHHLIATIAGTDTDLFAGPENQLLQAELPQQGFSLTRKGFVLTPPKRPIAPPTE
jgi:hypothetical protein